MFFTTTKLSIEEKGLYCAWIRKNERPGAPLVAVWIDPSMSTFAQPAIADPGTAPQELQACEEE